MNRQTDPCVIVCAVGALIFAIAGVIAKVWLSQAAGLLSCSVTLALAFLVERRLVGRLSRRGRWLLVMSVALASVAVLEFTLFS